MNLQDLLEDGFFGRAQRQSDSEYRILCPNPEHDDSNPSCDVNIQKGVFYCHSCEAKGHISKALAWLGFVGDIELPKVIQRQQDSTALTLLDENVLFAWDYLPIEWVEEGFHVETLDEHRIGFDEVNQRITVPIFDRMGQLYCISGRTVDAEYKEKGIPKYKVYKGEVYSVAPHGYKPKKNRVLWRHHMLTEQDLQKFVIVVEGFKQAMWLYQNGFNNVVATMGKNVTQEQIGLLCSMKTRIMIMFDQDVAGRKGARELGINLYRNGIDVYYVCYEDMLSPDDLTKAQIELSLNEATPHLRSSYGKMEPNC